METTIDIIIIIIIGVSCFQYGSNWQSLTVDLSSSSSQARIDLYFFLLDEIVLSSIEGTFHPLLLILFVLKVNILHLTVLKIRVLKMISSCRENKIQ